MTAKKPDGSAFYKNFAIGGIAGMTGTSIIQPIDMIKVRIQLASMSGGATSPFVVAREIHATAGIKGFYAGLDAALMRQAVYATARLGLYFNMSEWVKVNRNKGENLTFFQKVYCSLVAGGLGSGIATPTDLALVRMQADLRPGLADSERRNYKGVFDALKRIVADEGFKALYTGGMATMMRAMTLNCCMLATYDQTKETLRTQMPDISARKLAIYSSLVASVFTATGTLPADNIKTKVQNQQANAEGIKPYNGIADCFKKTIAAEGVTGLWAGLPTFYFRVGPHSIIVLLVAESLRTRYL